jgi:hypothetical protein
MKRRDFLRSAGVVSAALTFPRTGSLLAKGAEADAEWRTFEVTTIVQVLRPSGMTRIWMPAALVNTAPFQKTLANEFKAEGGSAKMVESETDTLGIIAAEFPQRREADPYSHKPDRDQELCGGPVRRRQQAAQTRSSELGAFFTADETAADRRHREDDSDRNHKGRKNGPRKGARDLYVDRRKYVSESENERLREWRHPLYA